MAEFQTLCGRPDVFACRISCLYESYSVYPGLADFWVQMINDKAAAIFARYSGTMTVYALPQADQQEIEAFLCMTGFRVLESNIPVLSAQRQGVIMQLTDPRPLLPVPPGAELCYDIPPMKQVYELMESCRSNSFQVPAYEDFVVELSHRLRHSTARCCHVQISGTIAAFAMTAALSRTAALIGSVCTAVPYRRQGMGSACLMSLVSSLTARSIFIIRAFHKNESFYHSLGFSRAGYYFSFRT